MHDIDCATFLEQDNPDALILAILRDFKGNPAQDVVNLITRRLHELFKKDIRKFRDYMGMLEVLSENRELGDFSQRIYHLACLFVRILRCDISYIARYAPDIAP